MSEHEAMALRPDWSLLTLLSVGAQPQLCAVEPPLPWDDLHIPRRSLTLPELRYLAGWCRTGDAAAAAEAADLTADGRATLDQTLADFGLLTGASSRQVQPAEGAPTGRGADTGDDHALIMEKPIVWRLGVAGFERYDHDGERVAVLEPLDIMVAHHFAQAATVVEAWSHAQIALADELPDIDAFRGRASRLVAIGVLDDASLHADAVEHQNVRDTRLREGLRNAALLRQTMRKHRDAWLEQKRQSDATRDLISVYPVVDAAPIPSLALGAIMAAAAASDDPGLEALDLEPLWLPRNADLESIPVEPAIFLFTDYIWTHRQNLDISAAIKARNPDAIIVHGGPDCPSYAMDTRAYLHDHPYVDVAVRGEGEATAIELFAALGRSGGDLCELGDVAGLTYRHEGKIVRTADRDRIAELDCIPSPYLAGTFSAYESLPGLECAIIETNRGCPYGCTFCDWGSATNSRIRKFDLERVLAELDWCAANKVVRIWMADANFGIFSRDVEIAQRVADLKQADGFPRRFISNYAKNTVKHLRHIVEILATAGIVTEGLLSLQSMDENTLATIRRSNIKLEKYEALATEFREEELPLFVDLMMGLPGQTLQSLRNDLQQCVNRDVLAKCHGTELLVNSPMNEPEYRTEHAVESVRPPGPPAAGTTVTTPALVVSATTFTRADYSEMHRMRRSYLLNENLGVMRHISRFMRQAAGIREVDFFERVRAAAHADPQRWPSLRLVVATVPDTMAPPVSWAFYVDDLHRYVVEECGVADDSALATVLAVQHHVLPAADREFPTTVELAHDYGAWYRSIHQAKDDGHREDWEAVVPPLETYGPARFEVTDPRLVCRLNLGAGSSIDAYNDWELASPVSRAVAAQYLT
ncbi:MAG: radical SAM protein [Acidimicrobiales bacterium]|nr:radical SAM protein [Acidimicrobiales bacterium]